MKAKYKKKVIVLHQAILPCGKRVRIKGDASGFKNGQEIEGEYRSYNKQDQYTDGSYARSFSTIEEFVLNDAMKTKS